MIERRAFWGVQAAPRLRKSEIASRRIDPLTMIRKRHRTNFLVSLVALGAPLLFHSTAGAHVPSHHMLSGEFATKSKKKGAEGVHRDVLAGQEDDESGDGDGDETINIKTTAYTHTESDHVQYGRKSAVGTTLKSGAVTSAAADWSKFPVGTKFKIAGRNEVYVIDDYGSALVGKEVIDLYRPSRSKMNEWGARMVDIEVVEWGDFEKSLEILRPRAKYASHIRKMIRGLEERQADADDFSSRG